MSNKELQRPLFTILCPVYNEERTIPLFYQRIKPILDNLCGAVRCQSGVHGQWVARPHE